MSLKFSVITLVILLIGEATQEVKYNQICAENPSPDACTNIKRNLTYECETVVSKTDCFLNIDQGLSQLALVYAEQALLAAPLVSDKVVVVGTVVAANSPYQTAVIVRKPFDGGFEKLRGKHFCHPGYKHDEVVSRYVLEEFESKILNVDGSFCGAPDKITLVEKRIRALSNFFGSSCKPGVWTQDDKLDKEWKSTYSSLCDFCGSQKCDTSYQVPFNDTLTCLTQSSGDVALTTLKDAEVFFNTSNNIEKYQYICPDGTVRDAISPCTWTRQLDRVLITGKDYADTARNFLSAHLQTQNEDLLLQSMPLADSLNKVLEISGTDKIILLNPATSLKAYVESRRSIPNVTNNTQCKASVKWCTLNEGEQQKCSWLQQAALNAGIQPVIECVQSPDNDTNSCLKTIESKKADIAFTEVNNGYMAMQKGLTVVAYPETEDWQLSSILIVVRNDTTDIKRLKDLKGKPACLPEYGGEEWLAFIDSLRSNKIVPSSCDYKKLFSDFVGDSCIPGSMSEDYELEDASRQKLCSRCVPESNTLTAKYCNADGGNKYYTSDGALRCLLDRSGDYAVVTVNDVTQFNDTSMFRVLSKNGTVSELPGINNLDKEAPLTIITSGEVVARNDSNKISDIILLLRDIEVQFGESLKKTFKVFEKFNQTKDLIFPDSTPGLAFGGSDINQYVENFKTLLRNSEKCFIDPNSDASKTVVPSTILMLIGVFVLRY